MTFVRPNIAALSPYVPGEQPTDPAVIKLNTNENPYPPSPRVMEAVRAIRGEQLRRYPSPMADAFRQAAGQVLGLPADHILATNGGDELLDLVFRAVVGEKDRVGYFTPSYSLYPVLADIAAAHKAEVPYRSDWTMDVETMIQAFPKLVLVTNPNAPSGTAVSPAMLFGLAVGLAEHGGVLLVDEAYVDFAPENCLSLVARLPNLIVLRSMSKGYSLAGMRFGYAVAQPALIQELVKVKSSYNVDAVAIAAATAAIQDQDYAQETWRKVRSERERLTGELRRRGFELPDSVTNFVFARVCSPQRTQRTQRKTEEMESMGKAQSPQTSSFSAEISEPKAKAMGKEPAEELYLALKAHGILVRYWNVAGLHHSLRISIGRPEQTNRLVEEIDRWRGEETPKHRNVKTPKQEEEKKK